MGRKFGRSFWVPIARCSLNKPISNVFDKSFLPPGAFDENYQKCPINSALFCSATMGESKGSLKKLTGLSNQKGEEV